MSALQTARVILPTHGLLIRMAAAAPELLVVLTSGRMARWQVLMRLPTASIQARSVTLAGVTWRAASAWWVEWDLALMRLLTRKSKGPVMSGITMTQAEHGPREVITIT